MPSIDWSALGPVSLLGSFSTLSFHNPARTNNTIINSKQAILLSHPIEQHQQSEPTIIASTNIGGAIHAICLTKSNQLIIGGRFDALNSTSATSNIAIYNPQSHTLQPLSNSSSIQGSVYAIDCLNDDQIWIAGQFQNPVSNDQIPNLVSYSAKTHTFQSPNALNLPDFNGPIYSLDHLISPAGESLIIGGQFSIPINTNNPQQQSTSSSTPLQSLGSSLAPIPLSNQATWSASPESANQDYRDPQAIFCPQTPDGPRSSWELDHNFDNGALTINLGTSVPVGGIRLGNSFANGGGTAGFHLVSLPDDQVLNLTFINPITNQLDSCTTNCTLSRDLNIPFQDYLFPPNTAVNGVQLVITSKFGNVAGLHLLQLLSQGNTAYAVDQLNSGRTCQTGLGAAGQNTVKTTGNWNSAKANTNLPGTVQPVLTASVPPGTTPDRAPTLTWTMWVPQSGHYELVLQTPGCAAMGDCASRTTLAATTSLVDGPALRTIVDTRSPNDTSTTLYNGTLTDIPSGGGDVTVTIRLADTVSGSSPVTMVANQLVLRSNPLRSHLPGVRSNGVYEHVIAGKGAFGDGSTLAPAPGGGGGDLKETLTAVDQLGLRLRPDSAVRSVIGDDHLLFIAGNRLSVVNGTSAVATTTMALVPNGGLNGAVNVLLTANGVLYAGGNFTATADGAVKGLDGLACWKYGASSTRWESFSDPGSTVGFPVQAFQLAGDFLYVFGRSTDIGGRALGIFNTRSASWVPSTVGVYFGQLTAAATRAGDHPMLYLAGNLDAMGSFEAPSGALLSTGSGGTPSLSGLNFQMNQLASQAEGLAFRAKTQNNLATESVVVSNSTALSTRSLRQSIQRRQAPVTNSNLNVSLPYALTGTNGPTILTGAFYKDRQLIIGGRFVSGNSVSNVGIYDLSASELRPLNGSQLLDGAVLSIKIVNDVAWIGGLFVSPSGKNGLDTYNLTSGKWATETMAGVGAYPSTNVSVRTIKSRSGGDVVVGGRFQRVGSLSCQSICLWSGPNNQWYSLGNGLKGVVNALELVGKAQDKLIAVGRFELNQTVQDVGVARWVLDSATPLWTPLGSQERIPGTVRTMAVGELAHEEPDGMFIAGQRAAGDSFLMRWQGDDWAAVSGLDPASQIEHIAFVPIRNPSTSINTLNGIKNDRMLLVSGWIILQDNSPIKLAAVLYDGQSWFPYLSAADYNSQPGILGRMVTASEGFKSTLRRIHSVVQVIFISMSIALGIVLIGVLIGFLIGYKKRAAANRKTMYGVDRTLGGGPGGLDEEDESEGDGPVVRRSAVPGGAADTGSRRSSGSGIETRRARRPTSLLATIDAATAAMTERMQSRKTVDPSSEDHKRDALDDDDDSSEDDGIPDLANEKIQPAVFPPSPIGPDNDHQPGSPRSPDHDLDDGDHLGLLAETDVRRARWSFDPQLPGEIAVAAGESVEVRDRSNQEWWLVRRADGVEGVVPADWFL
ncbi:hypothetical protein PtA15_12A550 [Puccinia triticina]|uniref:SH3 domain-containing protein n=1 Tax=Puccinia triticina TaxID=208348 RepID=A0ABY7D3I3_9BASI|nr:uncharacterized protein PtA15_12A550 [Puccinia triticina]WAQ90560.1 hypothetical protein PtA15_12A550 [Puccinia triticina]WAR61873.1 hypothetical protein PtB15_12B565 [Puccinia triticina]